MGRKDLAQAPTHEATSEWIGFVGGVFASRGSVVMANDVVQVRIEVTHEHEKDMLEKFVGGRSQKLTEMKWRWYLHGPDVCTAFLEKVGHLLSDEMREDAVRKLGMSIQLRSAKAEEKMASPGKNGKWPPEYTGPPIEWPVYHLSKSFDVELLFDAVEEVGGAVGEAPDLHTHVAFAVTAKARGKYFVYQNGVFTFVLKNPPEGEVVVPQVMTLPSVVAEASPEPTWLSSNYDTEEMFLLIPAVGEVPFTSRDDETLLRFVEDCRSVGLGVRLEDRVCYAERPVAYPQDEEE